MPARSSTTPSTPTRRRSSRSSRSATRARRPSRDPQGRDAEPGRHPSGLPLQPALSDRDPRLPRDRSGAARPCRRQGRAPRRLHQGIAGVDLVLTGGKVFTAGVAPTVAEAVAVRDGRIAWVGRATEAADHAGPGTRVLELDGRAVLPGFQDAHCHPAESGVELARCSLNDAHSREACLKAIARYAAEHPELEWVVGSGWSIDSFEHGTPSRADLDAILPGRPAFFDNRDGHGAWVNSRALALAGITRETRTPPAGASSATPRGSRRGRCTSTRCASSATCFHRRRRTSGRPGSCARRRCTTSSASRRGRTRASTTRPSSRPTGPWPAAAT